MRKSEVETSKDVRQLLQIATSCKEIVSSNCKNTLTCGSTVSPLFWLHLDSQSFKIVRKFYLPYPALLLMVKETLQLLVVLHLTMFYYISINIADQNMSFLEQVGRIIGQISIS